MSQSNPCVLAADVGGSAVKLAYATPDGQLYDLRTTPIDDVRAHGDVLTGLARLLAIACREAPAPLVPQTIGLVVPGIVDEAAGVGRLSYMLGWRDAPVRDRVRAATGLPTRLGHDVSAAAVAEATSGAARGHCDWVFLALGTGLGSALVLGGRPYRGSNGWGGELSHVVVDADGPACRCGKRGCLEVLSSASALSERYAERAGLQRTAAEVAALAHGGDAVASAVWADAVEALATVLAGVVESLNPSLVVVGGGVATSGAQLLDPLRCALQDRVAFVRPVPDVVSAELGVHAGVHGAALLGLELLARGGAA